MKTLIVDDTSTNLRLLRAVLEGENFEVVEAADGLEALAVLEREPVDAIISDILMPNMDGYRLCNEVRRDERYYHLPFIVYTSTYNSPADEKLALEMGADKYIKKPAPIKEITDALAEIARRGPRRRAEIFPPQQELNLAKLYNETLISKLEQKNQELSQQTEALRVSEENFRQLAANINEVCWIAAANPFKILYISPAYEKIWGRDSQALYQNPASFIDAIHAEDRPQALAVVEAVQRGEEFDLEHRIIRPDGQIRWIHARGSAIRNEAGAIYRVAGIAEDITRRKVTEQQFRQAQKMEGIGQLAGGVAHDFNNLLAIIGGNLELFLMTTENIDPRAREYLSQIAHASERAAALNRQLLHFSRSEAMQMQLLSLNELTAAFTKMLRRIVGEHIRVQNDLAPTLPPIKADPGMIEQVLMNLGINARDAMPNGGQLIIATAAVEIDPARAKLDPRVRVGPFICLSVRDTGTGIAPENMSRIFEPFFTTKGVGKGTGLGLATVFGIAEQHKGWVDVSSELGAGTVFRVYLPITPEPAVAPNPNAPQKVRGGSEKILLVEDEELLRSVLVQTLENYGYEVVKADSGISAQQLWSRQGGEFDLLLTDMVMPGGMTGLELGALLRAQKPSLKVILTSGYSADLAGAALAREKGITFMHKPFTIGVLAGTVRRCLDSRESSP